LFALVLLASLGLAGCQGGETDPYADAPKSDVPGPGKDALDQWAKDNPKNGEPGHDEPGDADGK
jgi:hypothetical protein